MNLYDEFIKTVEKPLIENILNHTRGNQIKASSFLIVCDYKLSSENKLSYLLPRLIKQSDLVKNVKITQSKIDFVIER